MSSSPQGFLYYGFPLPEISEGYGAFEDAVGPIVPEDFDPFDVNTSWESDHVPARPETEDEAVWDAWREKYWAWCKTIENIRIDCSGGEGSEQRFIHCAGLQLSVEWDEQIPLVLPEIDEVECQKWLNMFCEKNGLPIKKSGWYLATRYS